MSSKMKRSRLVGAALAALCGAMVLVALAIGKTPRDDKLPAQYPVDVQAIRFGEIWCPDAPNSGRGFAPVADFAGLPNDPLGDGINNCYQAAFDTSVFSADGRPVAGCANVDMARFPAKTCHEIRTPQDFKASPHQKNAVLVLMNDLIITADAWPSMGNTESLFYIGTYDRATKRPVMLQGDGVSSIWNLNSLAEPGAELTVVNLRMKSTGSCLLTTPTGGPRNRLSVTMVSVSGLCAGRFAFAGYEASDKRIPDQNVVDDLWYLKNVLARGGTSHSIYLDRNYLNWVEDSIVIGPWANRKHALKLVGQHVVVRNSLLSNQGLKGEAVDFAELRAKMTSPPHGIGGLSPLDMMTCGQSLIDGVTTVTKHIINYGNYASIQWQKRKLCSNPVMYHPTRPTLVPYRGPILFDGRRYDRSPLWTAQFWESPPYFDTFVINSNVIKRYQSDDFKKVSADGVHAALMSQGTYPAARTDTWNEWIEPEELPPGWVERKRIHVSGNCMDNGHYEDREYYVRQQPGLKYQEKKNEIFVLYGENSCNKREPVDAKVAEMAREYLTRLPAPPWQSWN